MSRENEGPRRGTEDQLEPDAPSIVAPMSRAEIAGLGFEPTRRGWRPLTEDRDCAMRDADERRTHTVTTDIKPFAVTGNAVPCVVCGAPAEPSTVGTPTCSEICVALVAHNLLPGLAGDLLTCPDGSGGSNPVRPPKPPRLAPRPIPQGSASVERARERLGACTAVLERHSVTVRGRKALCPFHEDREPSLSLYERDGRSRFRCHGCGVHGDALDLEALLTDSAVVDVVRAWGR